MHNLTVEVDSLLEICYERKERSVRIRSSEIDTRSKEVKKEAKERYIKRNDVNVALPKFGESMKVVFDCTENAFELLAKIRENMARKKTRITSYRYEVIFELFIYISFRLLCIMSMSMSAAI